MKLVSNIYVPIKPALKEISDYNEENNAQTTIKVKDQPIEYCSAKLPNSKRKKLKK